MAGRVYPEPAAPVPLRPVDAEGVQGEPAPDAPAFSPQRFLFGTALVLAMAAGAFPFLPRLYESTATLVLTPTGLDSQMRAATPAHQPLDESFILSDLDTLRSVPVLDRLIRDAGLSRDPEFLPGFAPLSAVLATAAAELGLTANRPRPDTDATLREALLDHMVLRRDRQSYTVTVGFRSRDPDKAALLAGRLVEAWQAAQIARKQEQAEALTRELSDRAERAAAEAAQSRAALEAFLERTGLIDQGSDRSLEAQLVTLSTELATARARAIEARTRAESLARLKRDGTLDSAPDVLSSPTIQRLNQSLTESMARVAVISSEARNIMNQASAERDRIVAGAAVSADDWELRESRLSAAIAAIRAEMVVRRKQALTLETLRRDADTDSRVLVEAETRLKGAAPDPAALRPDATLLSPPVVADRPVFPSLPLYAAGALATALAAGAALNLGALRRQAGRVIGS